jgi:flavin reductase (DIM6/NTAB) family NADH-FMN oxidoreductase RutF
LSKQGQHLPPIEVIPYALWICLTGKPEAISTIVVTWVTRLSFAPPLVGVALETDSEFLRRAMESGELTLVMLPREGGKDIAKRILKAGGAPRDVHSDPGVLATVPWGGVPHGALGALHLRVTGTTTVGDHTLLIGTVAEEVRWTGGEPLHLSDTGWKYTKPGTDAAPSSSQN